MSLLPLPLGGVYFTLRVTVASFEQKSSLEVQKINIDVYVTTNYNFSLRCHLLNSGKKEKESKVHLIVIPKYLDNARSYRFRLNSVDIEAANAG